MKNIIKTIVLIIPYAALFTLVIACIPVYVIAFILFKFIEFVDEI